jgi:hypothetical protein
MKKRLLFVVLCVLLVAMSLSACGSGGASEESPSSSVEVPESSSSDDGDKDESEDLPYFDEKTRILTAGNHDRVGVIDIYIPEGYEYNYVDNFCLGGTAFQINEKDNLRISLCFFEVSTYAGTTITPEEILSGLGGENGHNVTYGGNEYFTNEGTPGKNGDYFYIIKNRNNDNYFRFIATSKPELKSKLDEVLTSLKFK